MKEAPIASIAAAIEAATPQLNSLTNDLLLSLISGKRILNTAIKLLRHRLSTMKANTKLNEASVKIDGENANKTWEYCLDNFPSPQEVGGGLHSNH